MRVVRPGWSRRALTQVLVGAVAVLVLALIGDPTYQAASSLALRQGSAAALAEQARAPQARAATVEALDLPAAVDAEMELDIAQLGAHVDVRVRHTDPRVAVAVADTHAVLLAADDPATRIVTAFATSPSRPQGASPQEWMVRAAGAGAALVLLGLVLELVLAGRRWARRRRRRTRTAGTGAGR